MNKQSGALQIAARCWCTEKTQDRVMDPELAEEFAKVIETFANRLEYAWTVIANAGGGDWTKETKDWQEAAARFRDEDWHATCDELAEQQ